MTTHPLIGLVGRKRVGKDTFALTLVDLHGYTRVAFADPIRDAALALDPIVGRPAIPGDLDGSHDLRLSDVIDAIGWERAKEHVPEVRRTLQRLGTEVGRTIDPDVWVRLALERIAAASGPVVVTDVRFENEANAIKRAGGALVRITRPEVETDDPHPSETALDDFPVDHIVRNVSRGHLAWVANALGMSM